MVRIFYNKKSNNSNAIEDTKKVEAVFKDEKFDYIDVTEQKDIRTAIESLPAEDTVILSGGDGTLNHLVNDLENKPLSRDLYYWPAGSGNDFYNDMVCVGKSGLIKLNDYITGLPTIEINGKKSLFINGVGYGIDGYCCEVADEMKKTSDKPINYSSIAIKGLLGAYGVRNAKVTVDGVVHVYEHVWLAPIMNGRYFGGGMKIAPDNDRERKDGTICCVVVHNPSRLGTLINFPKITSGAHAKLKKIVDFYVGKEIKVEYDKPTAAQIDGETVLGVTEIIGRGYNN